MKDRKLIGTICRNFCSFYKPDKEDLFLCGTFRFIMEHFSPDALRDIPSDLEPDFSEDDWIMENICRHCEFLVDGCDYREGNPSPPCGGYVVVEFLRKKDR